jgi:hypothetical protein
MVAAGASSEVFLAVVENMRERHRKDRERQQSRAALSSPHPRGNLKVWPTRAPGFPGPEPQ